VGVVARLSDVAQNAIMNAVIIFLAVTVGANSSGEAFLRLENLAIVGLGLVAFCLSTVGGILGGKIL
jgi:oxaloacetate decarboxylase beta subunit